MADKASIEITASSAKFISEFNRAASSAKGAASQIGSALSGIKSAAAGLGASLSIAGLGLFVKHSIDAADALNDLSKRTGVAATTIGGIGFAAKQAGGDVEGAAQAFKAFNKYISEALGGNQEAVDNFRKLGISVGDLRKLSPDELLIKTADAFSTFSDGAEKAAGATVFFGKGAASVAGILDEGGESLRRNIEYWKRYSGVTDDLVRASDQFNDSLTKLSLLNRSFGNYLAAELLPSLQSLADYLLKAKENSTAFEDAARGVADTIRALAKIAISGATTFTQFAMALAATAAQLKAIASLNFSGVMEIERALQEGIARSEERAQGLMRAVDGARKAGGSGFGGSGTDGGVGGPGSLRKKTPNFTSGGGAKKEVDDFQKSVERARKEIALANAEYQALFAGGTLTKAQKDLAALQSSDEWQKLTKPQQEYLTGLYKTAEALERQADAFKESQKEAEKLGKELQDRAEEQEKLVKALNDSIGAFAESNKAIEDEISLVGKDARAFALLAAERERDRLIAQAASADRAQDLPLIEQEYQKRIQLINRLADTVTQFNQKEQIRSIFADSFADELTMVIDGTKSISDAFRDMERQIVRSISNIAAQNLASALFGNPGSGGAGGFFESIIKSLAGSLGGFANGTSFAPGGLAVVGERGPEIVNLPRGSSVTPNNKLGGNVISINVNVPAGTNGQSADRIAVLTGQAVSRAMRRNG